MDSGRYKFLTDGEHNTIALCIKKSRPEDEDDYKVIVTNPYGSDEAEMHLFVSGEFSTKPSVWYKKACVSVKSAYSVSRSG